jgi:hypothetical protein
MKNSNKIISSSWICPVVEVEDGEIAFELNDDLMDQLNLKSGDTIVFKNTLKDRYSMVIIRDND